MKQMFPHGTTNRGIGLESGAVEWDGEISGHDGKEELLR